MRRQWRRLAGWCLQRPVVLVASSVAPSESDSFGDVRDATCIPPSRRVGHATDREMQDPDVWMAASQRKGRSG
jgi:hypothetical protein